jgi:hypothetical protein
LRHHEKEVEDLNLKVQILDKESRTLVDRQRVLGDNLDNKVVQNDKTQGKIDLTSKEVIILQ